jgi:hypothetical protein
MFHRDADLLRYVVSGVKPKLALLALGFVWIAASECLDKD